MNTVGITPPFTWSTNSKPLPRASGSTLRKTSPNWPAPPVCFLCRQWPSAFLVIDSRYGILGGLVARSSLYCAAIFSSFTRMCSSPSPRTTVSCVVGWRSIHRHGSSISSLCSTSKRRCSSPFFLVSTAMECIGVGKSSERRRMLSSSWESCSTALNSISSTLAMAPRSPGKSSFTSMYSLPCTE